jgi:LmbE family N-acetylglucosaminyl deacetylase
MPHQTLASRSAAPAVGAPTTTASDHRPDLPTVVVLHAHPDDEAIFTGLFVRRLVDAGGRVVLVTTTGGEEGESRVPLLAGESMRRRRVTELERSCELLGVARLEVLPYRDSGCHAGPYRPGSLGAAAVAEVAGLVARVVEREDAVALVHYDPRGIYGHVDHVQVHRAGALVVDRLGVTGYEATVDTAQLNAGPRHVLHGAAGEPGAAGLDVGVPGDQITLTVYAAVADLLAKMAAMAAHGSQIGPEYLDPLDFAAAYGREWFVRRGAPGVVDRLLGGSGVPTGHEPALVAPASGLLVATG